MNALIIYSILLLELILVSIEDIRTKKISNFWHIVNLLYLATLFVILPSEYPFSLDILYIPLLFLIVGFFLFALKMVGAGDAKFLATFYLIVPLGDRIGAITALLESALVVSIFMILYRLWKRRDETIRHLKERNYFAILHFFKNKIPFAPVILLSWIYYGITKI